MKKYLNTLLFTLPLLAFSQQGILDSNFGLGEYNYVENEFKSILSAINYDNDTLYIAGYSVGKTDNSPPFPEDMFSNKDSFFFYNSASHKTLSIPVGDNGSRANSIKHYGSNVYLAGYANDKNNKNIAIVKLVAKNATLPVLGTFSRDNKVITDFTNDDAANAIDIKDNKIWIGGRAGDKSVIVRYNISDGYTDKTFNQKGFVFYTIGTKSEIKTLKILSDNKIMISGTAKNGSNTDFFIAKLNADGSYDNTFGINGIKTIDFYGQNDQLNSIKILDNGKVLLAGYCTKTATNIDAAIVRLNADGSLDTSFNGTGKVSFDAGTKEDVINYIDVKINNYNEETIYALGYKKSTSYKDVFYQQFYTDGNPNPHPYAGVIHNISFYDDYLVAGAFGILPLGNSGGEITMLGNRFCRETTGRYIQFGSTQNISVSPSTCGQANPRSVSDVKIRQDGKIYVLYQKQLKRYLNNGILDTSFGNNGTFTDIDISRFDLLPNNRIVANVTRPGTATQSYNIMLNDSGMIIYNFEFKDFQGANQMYINGMNYSAVKNKIYAYYSTPYSTQLPNPLLCRYNLDGSIDTSFANNNQYLPIIGSSSSSADVDFTKIDLTSQRIVTVDFTTDKKIIKLYDLEGIPVMNFGNNGIVEVSYTPSNGNLFKKIVLDNTNNVYLITEKTENFTQRIEIEKYNSSGVLDVTYGSNGTFSYSYGTDSDVYFFDVKVQSDDKILISGKRTKQGISDHGFVFRLNGTGSFDTTFGAQNNGFFSDMEDNNPNDFFEIVGRMGLTSDNKIIIGGFNKTRGPGSTITYNAKIKKLN
ncbi:delta-60 repeat domain-containing protein [Chryseobacterium sp. CFS15]|uniref:delta-60 repeat domain-containing protein n=1 Tax=Chryseobacterium sp. CFS15 TaxID=2986946 RepID=UPI0028070DF7|nr:delta-60 repeat domain-containing protein [Chryseobacterium sp. CFS15]MDQ8142529.1 delta-60 repeat domain-containing protein [Chryseobacterium sp. CFS15]